jgi:hypothetical protein
MIKHVSRAATGYETWVHYHIPETNHRNKKWKHYPSLINNWGLRYLWEKLWQHCLRLQDILLMDFKDVIRLWSVLHLLQQTHLLTAIKPRRKAYTIPFQTTVYIWQHKGAPSCIVQQVIEYFNWSWKTIELASPFTRPPIHLTFVSLFLSLRIYQEAGLLRNIEDKRWTMLKSGYYLHTGQSWGHKRGNKFRFKTR